MENTAKNFALQLGALIFLYISIGALINLLLSAITVMYPDTAQMPYEYTNATSSIRYSIAMLVVFFPAYAILTRMVNNIRRTEHGTYLALTKWLIYLSLLVAGIALLGDLVAILLGFLNGELTVRFILKALSVFVVVGAAFGYYLLDAKNYWQSHERNSVTYGVVVGVLVVIAIVFGYSKIEAPTQVREMNLDAKQVNDLMIIQSRIESFNQLHAKLPATIEEAYDGLEITSAPEGRAPYTYTVIDPSKFKLCANFAYPTGTTDYYAFSQPILVEPMSIKNPNDWTHSGGEWCFERIINTDQYTPKTVDTLPTKS